MKRGIRYHGRNIKKIKMWLACGLPVEYCHTGAMDYFESMDKIDADERLAHMHHWANHDHELNKTNVTVYRLKPQE